MSRWEHASIVALCILLAALLMMVIRPVGQGDTDTYPAEVVSHTAP
jgi:hypothetical protein